MASVKVTSSFELIPIRFALKRLDYVAGVCFHPWRHVLDEIFRRAAAGVGAANSVHTDFCNWRARRVRFLGLSFFVGEILLDGRIRQLGFFNARHVSGSAVQ